ncbi:hypothetical protein GQ607_016828 [Colletotrichum asianum]|uniref:Uncharacterized protein n=1 Tax=Colletotrichum asianum TaxID=702518 RepID=A0A8H3VVX6_9PEZI|nr:hypothetical protein GQ607_016828 [Colletotrichum asianum]
MHSPETLQTRINSFLQKLPALNDITALKDNVVTFFVDFEKEVASEIDFLEFRDGLPPEAVDIFVYCIGRSNICGGVESGFILFHLGWKHGRTTWDKLKDLADCLCWKDAVQQLRQEADSRRKLRPEDLPGVHVRKPGIIHADVVAVLLRQERPQKIPRRAKRGRPRKEVPTPVATSHESKQGEDDTSSEEEEPETARHKSHYPQDDEWSARSDSSDLGSDDGFAPLLASPSPPHNRAPPIASPESFSVDASEADIINLRPASPIIEPIDDRALISPEVNKQLSSPNASGSLDIFAADAAGKQFEASSSRSDFSALDNFIDPDATIDISESMDLTNVTIKRSRAQSDAAGTSTKRPKLPAKPDNNEGSQIPRSILEDDAWVSSRWLQNSLDAMTIGIDGVVVVDSSVLENLDRADYTRHRRLAAMFLVVVKLKDSQPYVVSLYDSLPSENNTKVARRRTQRFFELYLPNATVSVNRLFKRMAGPLQPNGHDCGVYVFATTLHVIVDEDLPSEYHSTLWRKIMAAALSEGGSWERTIVLPTPLNDLAKPPACDDGSATAYGDWEVQMKKWQEEKRRRMILRTEHQIVVYGTKCTHIEPAASVAAVLLSRTKSRLQDTTAQIPQAEQQEAEHDEEAAAETAKLRVRLKNLEKSCSILVGLVEALGEKKNTFTQALDRQEKELAIWANRVA